MCRVWWRLGRHFSSDNPLHYPQPFNRSLAHLAVICVQTDLHEEPHIDTVWLMPSAKDFVQSPGCGGLCCLNRRICERFTTFSKAVLEKFPPEARDEDRLVGEESVQLKRLLDRLDSPASEDQTFLHFACAQCQALELLARYDWVTKYRKRYMGKDRGDAPVVNNTITGAFTEDLDELDSLFHAGIPVWYLRCLAISPNVRIDSLASFIDDAIMHRLPLCFGGKLDTHDAFPSSTPVIYNGLAGKPKRYLHMLNYICSLSHYPSLLSSNQPRSSTSVIRSTQIPGRASAFSAVGGVCSTPKKSKPYPAKSQRPNKLQRSSNTTCGDSNVVNPFIDSSPLLPPFIPAWSDTLIALSSHNLSDAPPLGQTRGYYVPPPRLLVAPIRNDSKVELICNWLKVRDVWRSFLDIAGGNAKQALTSTVTGKQHNNMLTHLKDFLLLNSLSLQYGQLPNLPAVWKGVTLSTTHLPEKTVVQDILWELFELGFRQDLVVIDAELDQSSIQQWERQNLLDGY
ncbi:hypothetical protein V5O48_015926 [Marasmius crinis-equi]|uniref:Uncharacterized protein n=1 Tax=Marasmius crinis-equi TaxID=585013 RepID=A0ABR3ET54_9AGAR